MLYRRYARPIFDTMVVKASEKAEMIDQITPSSLLIFCAVSTYVAGFLFRDQVYLRLLVFFGSCFYLTYYYNAGPVPLWDAMLGSAMIGTASLQGMIRMLWSRLPISLPKNARHLRAAVGDIEPGLFKRLLKVGRIERIETPSVLTQQGAPPDALWFVVEGVITLERDGQPTTRLNGPCFVGDIAFMNKSVASASVTAEPGCEVLHWAMRDLRPALRRNHRLEVALEALIAQDLARKLAKSTPIENEYTKVLGGVG